MLPLCTAQAPVMMFAPLITGRSSRYDAKTIGLVDEPELPGRTVSR
jgi:hypothetical protein